MDRRQINNDYINKLKENEREKELLTRQMRDWEEKERCLREWERHDIEHLEQLHYKLRCEGAHKDRIMIEHRIEDTRQTAQCAKRQLDLEYEEIIQKRKQLEEQEDACYREAKKQETGGSAK